MVLRGFDGFDKHASRIFAHVRLDSRAPMPGSTHCCICNVLQHGVGVDCRVGLGPEINTALRVVAYHGKCSWQQVIGVQIEHGLDLGRQLVAQVKKPSARERKVAAGCLLVFAAPRLIKCVQETSCGRRDPACHDAIAVKLERLARECKQDVVASEGGAGRRTLQ